MRTDRRRGRFLADQADYLRRLGRDEEADASLAAWREAGREDGPVSGDLTRS
ncbi:MAG: hypothetical protein WAY93_09625 [Atopobiaceae bacterium]